MAKTKTTKPQCNDLFVRVPPELGDRIRKAAKAESRTVSGWLRVQLEKLMGVAK